ncbi:putative DNA binding domain-containing protein [Lipingzhangella sp. LS1_29]|uniref:DNA binding domain-containing protein n=1 Tax=Lipingzhangella rawalii TaxID=2055835 RepID=A0ABU2H955_9ACTN|nr:RNA-binding domain-containing protein [Lipingzhangella rawalii]MDS1271828.1 putative DNA binding domain-containing protein [Lipingzhangella rawalii]
MGARKSRWGWLQDGEDYETEFKSDRKQVSDHDLVEAVVCLANGSGGRLLIGVEDDGRVTGAVGRHEHGGTDPVRLAALIANRTEPPVTCQVNEVESDGSTVLVVEVPHSPRVTGTTSGTYLRRAMGQDGSATCRPLRAHELLAREIDRGAADFARLPIPGAGWEDLDPFEFERVRRLVAASGNRADRVLAKLSDREITAALGLETTEAEATAGALLLFGREAAVRTHIPTHQAAFQVQQRRATTTELATVTQGTEKETRRLLAGMVERGWIQPRGERKGRSWHLSAAADRELQAPEGYTRIRGFEPLQQEQMVLTHVTAHGSITRGQAAELCALSPSQASRLLKRLVSEGKLRQQGERKGTYYALPE